MKKLLTVLALLSSVNSYAIEITTTQLFSLERAQHTALAYDDGHLYLYTRKSDPYNLYKYTLDGTQVYATPTDPTLGNLLGLGVIDGVLTGTQFNGYASDDPPVNDQIVTFDMNTGVVTSVTDLNDSSPLGIDQVGNEIYILNAGGGGSGANTENNYLLDIFDLNYQFLRSINIPDVLNSGTISGFATIKNSLFISSYENTLLYEVSAITGELIDSYDVAFRSAGLASDGDNLYAASFEQGMQKISFKIPSPTPLALIGIGLALIGYIKRKWNK